MKPTLLAPGIKQRFRLLVGIIALAGLLLPAVSAKAIYNGKLDTRNTFSSVGIVYAGQTYIGGGWPDVVGTDLCNGVLIDPVLVLIHPDCFSGQWDRGGLAYVSFARDFDLPPEYPDAYVENYSDQFFAGDYEPGGLDFPDYNPCPENASANQRCYRGTLIQPTQGLGFPADLDGDGVPKGFGVLRLEKPVVDATPARLPEVGALKVLRVGGTLTTVGYGPMGANCHDMTDPETGEEFGYCQSELTRSFGEIEIDKIKTQELLASATNKLQLPCYEGGGGNFDAKGNLLALTMLNECGFDGTNDAAIDAAIPQAVVTLQRLDTKLVQRYVCVIAEQEQAALADSPYCGGSGTSTLSAAASTDDGGKQSADDGKQRADNQHKSKHKKDNENQHKDGGKHQGKGKRGH